MKPRPLIIIWICAMLQAGCNFKSAEDYLAEAEKLSEQGEYRKAIEMLDRAVEKDGKYIPAYINRGADKSELGNFEEAIKDYKKVLEIDPKNTVALFDIGNGYRRMEDFKTAIEYYNWAFSTKGGDFLYLDLVPNDFIDKSKYDVPGHQIHFERGIAFYNIDSLQRAFKDFKAALGKNYRTADCYYWFGYIYLSNGQTESACESFNKAKRHGDKEIDEELKKYCN